MIQGENSIHPGTEVSGIKCDMNEINPLEERTFYLPPKTFLG
jgi:hypothetical protein